MMIAANPSISLPFKILLNAVLCGAAGLLIMGLIFEGLIRLAKKTGHLTE